MDVPIALNDIRIQYGLEGYGRKSSTICLQADVVGLSALSTMATMKITNFCYSFLIKVERKRGFVH